MVLSSTKTYFSFLDLSVVYDHVSSCSDANQRRTVGLLSDKWDRLCEEDFKTSVEALSRNLHERTNENQRYASQDVCVPV
jgi:hypothetical protein